MKQALLFILMVFIVSVILKAGMKYEGDNMKVDELNSILKQGKLNALETVVLDVREPGEFAGGHIKEAVNIPVGEVEKNIEKIKKYKTAYVICLSGMRSASACRIIKNAANGATIPVNIEGGMSAWHGQNYECEK